MARNKFKSAINHIKSTKIDEKIQRLNEAPTNNTSSVYDLSPSGQRYGRYDRDPEKVFYANADGSWPSGVPGTPGERTYTRPIGYWEEGPGATPSVQHDEIIKLDFSYNTQIDNPRQTTTLIDEDTGRVLTDLPPNSRSFILGPLVDMYFHNHGYDNRTNIGYIQKDTREFVLLGYINGTWGNDNNGVPIRADGFEDPGQGFNPRIWDGLNTSFFATNPSFTFEMLQWHHDRLKEGKYVKNVSFFNSGGIPIQTGRGGTGQPAGSSQGNVSGSPIGGDAGNNGDADLTHGSGGEPTIGTQQNPPIPGNNDDADVHGPQGDKAALEFYKNALINAYERQYAAANQQAFALSGGILIGLSVQQLAVALTAIIVGGYGTVQQIQRRMDIQYSAAVDSLSIDSSLSDEEWEKQAERGRERDAQDAKEANERYEKAVEERKRAEESGDQERIERAKAAERNAEKNRERVQKKNTENRKQRSKERRNRGTGSAGPGGYGREQGAKVNEKPFGGKNAQLGEGFITESHKRILREIKQPVAEIAELKPEKLKKYRPNFKGRFTAQNTPDVTASKESDKIVKAKNAAGQTWRTSDKYWGGYESQERANVIYDHVGHGQLYWDEIVSHNQGKKGVRDREVQEQLNKHYAYLAEKKMMKELNLDEQETMSAIDDPLFKRVKNKLLPKIDYITKPSPMGYPNNPPVQVDPLTGMHPEYGKKYKHDKLDPISADAMPPTGDPEIDMTVAAQKTPLKSVKKVYKKTRQRQVVEQKERAAKKLKEETKRKQIGEAAEPYKSDWRTEISEGMTTAGMGMINYNPQGDIDLDTAVSDFTLSGPSGHGWNSVTKTTGSDRSKYDTIVVTVTSNSSEWEIVDGAYDVPENLVALGKGGTGTYTVVIPRIYRHLYYTARHDGSISFSTKFQRRSPVNVFVPLDDPEANSFMRGGLGGDKERRAKLKDMLDASNELMTKLGLDPSKTSPGDIELARINDGPDDSPSQIRWPRDYFPGKKAPPGPGARPSGKPIGPQLPTV